MRSARQPRSGERRGPAAQRARAQRSGGILKRDRPGGCARGGRRHRGGESHRRSTIRCTIRRDDGSGASCLVHRLHKDRRTRQLAPLPSSRDRKSTRLNSSHVEISYAVFCLKKKKQKKTI